MSNSSFDTVVTAPGSLGDVNPMLGIARSLQAKGRRVLFLAAEPYLPLAQRAGLNTRILTPKEEFDRLVMYANIWHPRHGARILLDHVLGATLENHCQWLVDHCSPRETLFVSHLLDFGGRIYRDQFPESTLVTVALAPVMFRSLKQPPRVSRLGIEHYLPAPLLRGAYWMADRFLDSLALKHINPLRLRIGVPPVRRMMKEWWMSPDLVVALFPDWFSVPTDDLHKQVQCFGFPLTDSATFVSPGVDEQLRHVLSAMADQRPVVFAPGSANFQAAKFLHTATEACRRLNLPAILLSPNRDDVPKDLPANVIAAEYLPFSKLLPIARAVVHHGGVGTTSQCFRAGVPQVVMPMAFDQFDNADRAAKLGCGSWLPMSRISVDRLAEHLHRVENRANQVKQIAARVAEAGDACDQAAAACIAKFEERQTENAH